MPLNYTAVNLGPIYTLMGVAAQFALASEDIIELTVLDKTGGIQIEEQGMSIGTIRPACICRMADLTDLSLGPEDLMDAVLEMNALSWKVKSYYPKPSPNGERDGELYLILNAAE